MKLTLTRALDWAYATALVVGFIVPTFVMAVVLVWGVMLQIFFGIDVRSHLGGHK